MLAWVPAEIRRRFGIMKGSMLNGEFLVLDPARAPQIIAAMGMMGYACYRDERLVQRACGYRWAMDQVQSQ